METLKKDTQSINEKKKSKPTKKELIRHIELLDKDKTFDLPSLNRTKIDNLITIKEMFLQLGRVK